MQHADHVDVDVDVDVDVAVDTAPPRGRVVVVGSANVDLVITVPRHPGGGETLLGSEPVRHPGGKGANQAVGAARAGGAATALVGSVGHDGDAELLLGSLRSAEVDVAAVARVDAATGTAVVLVDPTGENAIVVSPGANAHATITAAAAVALAAADVVLAQLEVPVETVTAGFRARRRGAVAVLNAAPSRPLPATLLDEVDVLVVNEHEAQDLLNDLGGPHRPGEPGGSSGQAGPGGQGGSDEQAGPGEPGDDHPGWSAAATATLLTAVPAVVITQGARGALVARRGSDPVAVPAPQVDAVDTTGAGDVFCGVLAARLATGADLVDAAAAACVAGALTTLGRGAQPAVPPAARVQDLLSRPTGSPAR